MKNDLTQTAIVVRVGSDEFGDSPFYISREGKAKHEAGYYVIPTAGDSTELEEQERINELGADYAQLFQASPKMLVLLKQLADNHGAADEEEYIAEVKAIVEQLSI